MAETTASLVRRLGMFDATMLVMGGIIGAGIFVNPAEVARHVGTPLLIVGVWIAGGLVALAASFVYAELAARRPEVGGQYAYLRDAYGPMPAFLYGWALLLVIQSGGMAAVRSRIRRSRIDSGIAPSFSTSWNWRISNLSPSVFFASSRARSQARCPIL